MKTEDLKKVAIRAKEVGIAIYGSTGNQDFDNIQIDQDGNISVHFSYGYGGNIDYDTVYLTDDDMTNPIEVTVAKYKKIAQDGADKKAQEAIENELELKLEKEKEELETYKKLKAKFDGSKT